MRSGHQVVLQSLASKESEVRELEEKVVLLTEQVRSYLLIYLHIGASQSENSKIPNYLVRGSLGILFGGKSSQNSPKPVLIFWSSIPFCLYSVYTLLNVVSYYDLSVPSMSAMGFQIGLTMQSPVILFAQVCNILEESPSSSPFLHLSFHWSSLGLLGSPSFPAAI